MITLILEFVNGTKTRHKVFKENYLRAFWNLVVTNKRRYGGYIIHIGVVLTFFAITGSAFNTEAQVSLRKGESFDVSKYKLRYDGITSYPTANKDAVIASLTLFNDGHKKGVLFPEKSLFHGQDQATSEVAIHTTLKEDLYVILAGYDEEVATFKVLVNPLVIWLWIGGGVMTLGTIIVMLPDRRKRKKTGSSERVEEAS
jgi:cytochrome c-type biogenesis protein CcmF